MPNKNIIAFLLFLISGVFFAQQQPVRVDAVLDTAKMRIGEQAKIDIYVTYNANLKDV